MTAVTIPAAIVPTNPCILNVSPSTRIFVFHSPYSTASLTIAEDTASRKQYPIPLIAAVIISTVVFSVNGKSIT